MLLISENANDALIEAKMIQRALQHIGIQCGMEVIRIDANNGFTHLDWLYTTQNLGVK